MGTGSRATPSSPRSLFAPPAPGPLALGGPARALPAGHAASPRRAPGDVVDVDEAAAAPADAEEPGAGRNDRVVVARRSAAAPAVEGGGGAERIEEGGWEELGALPGVVAGVVEDVGDGVAGFARGAQNAGVIAVGEDLSFAADGAIEGPG